MLSVILILIAGLLLSAFFSGSETGFYRVTRVRLIMDAKSGHWISKALLWMVNRVTMIVATVLIGNNIANYLVSLALVMAGELLLTGWMHRFEAFLPILMTPFLFIYGELLPKYLFYQAPYRLLRLGAPFMVLCTLLFLPISIVVIGLELLWKRLKGESSEQSSTSLERNELQRVLMEGQEAGVLQPIQRQISQNLFSYGARPVRQFANPIRGLTIVQEDASEQEISEALTRSAQRLIGVARNDQLIGYYQAADFLLSSASQGPASLQPIIEVAASETNIQVLTQMNRQRIQLAVVVDASGRRVGLVTQDRLQKLLVPST